ncbi:MAG: HAMP domain-containing protein, partial [Deltaproteobacteria bacterium]|nr:HAMP domain-containing protein [Deltaproteobacteria bacterium]
MMNLMKSMGFKILASLVIIVGPLGVLWMAYTSYSETQSLIQRLFGMFILLGAAIFALYFLLYQFVTKRIQTLSDMTLEISKGNLDVEIPDEGEDSIGQLADNLRMMVENQKNQEAFNSGLKKRIPVSMYFVDHDMTVTFMNPMACYTSGLKAEEVEGKMKCWEVWRSDKCQEECGVKNSLKTGNMNRSYTQVINPLKGAEIQTISASSAPITDSKGKILGALEIFVSINSELKSEKLLKDAAKNEEDNRKYLEERVEKLGGVFVTAAGGNLSVQAPVGAKDDLLDQLSAKTNETFDNMGKLIAQTKGEALGLARLAAQISDGNQDLSLRTQQ